MKFRYPLLYFIANLFVFILIGLLVSLFLYDAIYKSDFKYIVASSILFLFFLFMTYLFLKNLTLLVSTDDNFIQIRKLFNSCKIEWKNISEFGKYVSYKDRTGKKYVYYIKSVINGDKKIKIGTDGLTNINELKTIIFFKAQKAKFVILLNSSIIPFTKKFEPIEWNNDSDSMI